MFSTCNHRFQAPSPPVSPEVETFKNTRRSRHRPLRGGKVFPSLEHKAMVKTAEAADLVEGVNGLGIPKSELNDGEVRRTPAIMTCRGHRGGEP